MSLIKCSECGKEISDKANSCPNCGCPIEENIGTTRFSFFRGIEKARCPRCNSVNCSNYKETVAIPGKTKTSYSANLNPLKPFTLVNKKEKVIKKESHYDVNKFICNNCGNIFR